MLQQQEGKKMGFHHLQGICGLPTHPRPENVGCIMPGIGVVGSGRFPCLSESALQRADYRLPLPLETIKHTAFERLLMCRG